VNESWLGGSQELSLHVICPRRPFSLLNARTHTHTHTRTFPFSLSPQRALLAKEVCT
jgi:hypothetical protein